MDSITLRYVKSGTTYTQAFNAPAVRGFDDPDRVRLYPPLQLEMVDGAIKGYIRGFHRVITVDLGVVASSVDRRTIQEFLAASTRSLLFKGAQIDTEEVFVALGDPLEWSNEWKWDVSIARYIMLEVIDRRLRTVWPEIILPSDNMTGYTINHVKIEGTQTAPELFTTNVGKLQFNYGATPFPTMDLTAYIITVVANGAPYQDAKINQVGTTAQNANNIDFYLAVSDMGNPSGDGFYYADITFLMQAIV